jgi:hypothetical protein
MAKILDDDFMVCADCIQAIANDDYSSLDYYYNEQEAADRMAAIKAGMEASGGYIATGNSDFDAEFSRRPCDCCGSSLAGSRHHCVVLID